MLVVQATVVCVSLHEGQSGIGCTQAQLRNTSVSLSFPIQPFHAQPHIDKLPVTSREQP